MKITIELSDDVAEQLRAECAERGPLMSVEALAWWYLVFGMKQWHAYHQTIEQVLPIEEAPPPGAAGSA